MDKKEFKEKYEKASIDIDKAKCYAEYIRTMDDDVLYIGKEGTRNLVIVMEELAELQQQISKYLRGKEDRLGLIEEVADVIMGLDYVKIICNISDEEVNKAMNVKLQRLEQIEDFYE